MNQCLISSAVLILGYWSICYGGPLNQHQFSFLVQGIASALPLNYILSFFCHLLSFMRHAVSKFPGLWAACLSLPSGWSYRCAALHPESQMSWWASLKASPQFVISVISLLWHNSHCTAPRADLEFHHQFELTSIKTAV